MDLIATTAEPMVTFVGTRGTLGAVLSVRDLGPWTAVNTSNGRRGTRAGDESVLRPKTGIAVGHNGMTGIRLPRGVPQ